MIGVVARREQHDIVSEFFELFKTPWEFCRRDATYRVVLQDDQEPAHGSAELVLIYGSRHRHRDGNGPSRSSHRNAMLSWKSERIPIYGAAVSFPAERNVLDVFLQDTKEPVASVTRKGHQTIVRVGYDLFDEIRHLLTRGQPAAQAEIPALDLHIAFMRCCIVSCGIPVLEIPPVPEGHRFIVCLTHDVDHPAIRFHGLDHTMGGFLYRALIGSLIKAWRGRLSFVALRRNLVAALKLPFVHMGWADDFWLSFERYLAIEHGLGSTFFVIPHKNDAGRTLHGRAPRFRAAAYGVADIADHVRTLVRGKSEIGLHGIDAWIDPGRASAEREAVSRVARVPTAGSRMHWLYFDERAPDHLEAAGFTYDSTFGYTDAVGFRAGTLQAYKPLTVRHLLELPLHVMDTALFYPSRLNLAQETAREVVLAIVEKAERYGGALTVNWHDRSIAPERLWDDFYIDLIATLKKRAAWFPTAARAISWFRSRRSARFDYVRQEDGALRVRVSSAPCEDIPGLTLRVHTQPATFTDLPFKETLDARVALT
jgi:hypothetical protein